MRAGFGEAQICKQLLRYLSVNFTMVAISRSRWRRMLSAKTVQEQEPKIRNSSWAATNVAEEVSRLSNTCWPLEYFNKCRVCVIVGAGLGRSFRNRAKLVKGRKSIEKRFCMTSRYRKVCHSMHKLWWNRRPMRVRTGNLEILF